MNAVCATLFHEGVAQRMVLAVEYSDCVSEMGITLVWPCLAPNDLSAAMVAGESFHTLSGRGIEGLEQ